jgi:arabinofuranan 3-O-arabinosyltransferase
VFGFIRAHGGSATLAWTVQTLWSLALAAGTVWLWRSRAAFDLKAAALAAGTLLATPYLYMYDLTALAVAFAFLLRYALVRGLLGGAVFLPSEVLGLGAAGALILAFPYVETQVGLAAALIILALVAQRACCVATKSASH